MTISVFAKRAVARLMSMTGITSYILTCHALHGFIILMYHRILDRSNINNTLEPGMYVEAKTFDLHLTLLKNIFHIVSLKEVNNLIKDQSKYRDRMPCVITFDDGWLDFFTNASPILMKHKVPATVFLPTDFIGSEKWFWTDRLTFLFSGIDNKISLQGRIEEIRNPVARQVVSLKGNSIQKLDKAIRLLKVYRSENIEEIITELATAWGSDPNPPGRAFMSWEEVTQVAQSGLIEFGSHTASHPILTTLTNDEIREELKRSKVQLLEHKVVDPKFIPFCYPNGDFDDRIKSMVEDAGFSAAVTTRSGWNNPDEEIYALRRIGLHQDMSSNDALLNCRIAGLM